MNKQEVIDEIENAIPDFILNDYQRGKETGLTYALELVEELNEPEKPIVPQFVADWYEKSKNDFENNLAYLINDYFKANIEDNDLRSWFGFDLNEDQPIKILVNMHQFGYEIEEEKRYTAKLKISNEYLSYDKDYKEIRHNRVPDDIAHKVEGYHFTEDDLIAYNAWGNNAYEIKEVEGE